MWKRRGVRLFLKGIGAMVLLSVTAGVVAVTWLLRADYADLRAPLREMSLSSKESQGRALLARAAQRHGLDAWRSYRTAEIVATDTWSPDAKGWWPQPQQRIRAQRLLGTFTSRVELLDGPAAGETWGIQSWRAYKQPTGSQAPVILDDQSIRFYLPTLQYFDELPFRLVNAPIALYNGQGEYLGGSYERVLVTWASPEPHGEHDQYDVWINRETGLIDVVQYTVRDAVELASPLMRPVMKVFGVGTIHFRDYADVGGVMVPFAQYVTLTPPENTALPLDENFFHKLVVEKAAFDSVPPSELVVDSARPEPGDRKPEN